LRHLPQAEKPPEENALRYELYYWPGLQGRGEFVRLALEEAGADYVDVVREGSGDENGVPAMLSLLDGLSIPHPPFAPPFLRAGEQIIGQTANILLYLGAHHGLAPRAEAGRLWAHQLQLTVADFVVEIHDTHHPIASGLYYEEQRTEAKRRAGDFLANRAPKYLSYFERVLELNPRGDKHLVGARLSYPDLSLFQIVEGMRYAFPRAMARLEQDCPRLLALRDRVAARPRIAAYLASGRRIPFNETGIFRRYPELDSES
jgi:glutathione S-transferase